MNVYGTSTATYEEMWEDIVMDRLQPPSVSTWAYMLDRSFWFNLTEVV